jgi:SseB protein N-terminal domain
VKLVDAVVRAQSGYRSDVAALKAALGGAEIFVPLEDPGQIREGLQTLKTDAKVTIHNLRSADGTAWIPLFTTLDALRAAGEQNGWTTGNGPLQFLSIKGTVALESMFAPALESGANTGLVFDVGQRSELAMMADEVLQMLKGEPIPLVDYASKQPARGTEQTFVGLPAVPPPTELLDSIAGVLRAEQLVRSYAVRQVFIPERDVAPHLLLDISGEIPEQDRRRISQRVGAAMNGIKLPPPGYLDVAFNFGGESESK